MKTKLILLLCTFMGLFAQSQNKISVAFIPITYDQETVSSADARVIQEAVLNSFVETKKFTVVDREKIAEIEKEKKLQRSESFIDSDDLITDGVSKGASYLISPNILGVRYSNEGKNWETTIQLQLKVLDVSTGEILATASINSNFVELDKLSLDARNKYVDKKTKKEILARETRIQSTQKDKHDAFLVALERLSDNVKAYAAKYFPTTLEIVSWDNSNKNLFTIAAGENLGFEPGQLVDIIHITTVSVGNKTVERNEKVATAAVTKVDNSDFSDAIILTTEKSFKKIDRNTAKLKVSTK